MNHREETEECIPLNDASSFSSNGTELSLRNFAECRICKDEDADSNMETPCGCAGSLKYAHRSCVQQWCNQKGNTVCEICRQQFKPDYTSGQPLSFRTSWDISSRFLTNTHFVATVSTNRNVILDIDYEDGSASASRSFMCCHSVLIIFMFLLILRHALPVLVARAELTFPKLLLLSLRILVIALSLYLMVKAITRLYLHGSQQELVESPSPLSYSDEETENSIPRQNPSHILDTR